MARQPIRTENAPAPIGPYNQAILVNNQLFVSGQVPIDPKTGEVISGTIEEETELVMQNLLAILKEAGLAFKHVVKCSIFVSDMNNFAAVNAVYGKYFTEMPPARETVEVSRLPKDVQVEISCIAVAD